SSSPCLLSSMLSSSFSRIQVSRPSLPSTGELAPLSSRVWRSLPASARPAWRAVVRPFFLSYASAEPSERPSIISDILALPALYLPRKSGNHKRSIRALHARLSGPPCPACPHFHFFFFFFFLLFL